MTLASRGDSGFDPKPGILNIPLNDTSRTNLINGQISYRHNSSDTLDIRLGYSDSVRGMGDQNPNQTASGIAVTLRDKKTSSDFEQFTWLHTFHENSDLQLNYFHIGRNMKDDRYSMPCVKALGCPGTLSLAASGSYPINDDAVVHRHDLELQHTLRTSPENRIVWGMGMRQDSAEAPNSLRDSPVTWREYRLFAHDEWRITPASLVNIGGMWERDALGQERVSPRVSYNYHLSPRNTLRASISVAYRNPEMIEELGDHRFPVGMVGGKQYFFRDVLASGGLSPEKTVAREIGYIGKLDEAGSTIDFRAYHDQITDMIWVDPVPDAASITGQANSLKSDFNVYFSGLEGTLKYKLGTRSTLTVNYAHQVASGRATVKPTALPMSALEKSATGFYETAPLNSASLLLSHDFSGGLHLGAGFYHTDPVRIKDAGKLQPLTRYLDLRIARRFGAWRNKKEGSGGEIALVVQNALSDHYFEYSTQAIIERRAWLTATLGF